MFGSQAKVLLVQSEDILTLFAAFVFLTQVRMTRVPGLKTYINEYNVHAEILASGFGVNNPQHLDLLKRVFQGDENANTLQHLTDDRFITIVQISSQ